jgi:hypothetical protein
MSTFADNQLDTLLGLINQSNPGLQIAPLTPADLRTLVPTAITPIGGTIQDTSVRLLVLPTSKNYYGSDVVTYRRINLTNWFRNQVLTLNTYLGSTTMTPAQFCTAFNAKYGQVLQTSDFANASFTSGSAATVTILGTSLCYSGSFVVTWTQGKQSITATPVGTNPALGGRLYPGGNTFGTGRKPQGDFLTYNLDNTSIKTALQGVTSGAVITPANFATNGSIYAQILSFLQGKRPDLNLSGADSGTAGGLGNLTWTRYTLPSAAQLGANSAKFVNLTVVTAVSGSWFQGQLYLHYN